MVSEWQKYNSLKCHLIITFNCLVISFYFCQNSNSGPDQARARKLLGSLTGYSPQPVSREELPLSLSDQVILPVSGPSMFVVTLSS